tara:strand:+ start:102 stop:458 length:357 start_codon:yes stop_codon:yes gene_type:complete
MIKNPETGRMVFKTGALGQKIQKHRKKKSNKESKKTKVSCKDGKCCKVVASKHAASRNMVKLINRLEGRRVAKMSVKGNVRLSAGQARRDGAHWGTVHCYDGKCKVLKKDINGRAYWG